MSSRSVAAAFRFTAVLWHDLFLATTPEMVQRRLELGVGVRAAIFAMVEEGYPLETCGVLVGSASPRRVFELVPVRNVALTSPRTRFAVDPLEYRAVEARADRQGLSILGFVHSHPDAPPVPSETDAAYAAEWEGFSFVIASVDADGAVTLRSWRWSSDRRSFLEEELMYPDT